MTTKTKAVVKSVASTVKRKNRLFKRTSSALLLWQRLDVIRSSEGLSDTQFAQILGMSRQQYSNLRTNRQRVTTAWRIALEAMEAYGTSFIGTD